MPTKAHVYAIGLLMFLVVLWAVKTVISGRFGTISIMQGSLVFIPPLVFIAMSMQNLWLGTLIGLMPVAFALPVFPLDRYPIKFPLAVIIFGLAFAQMIIHASRRTAGNLASKCMMGLVMIMGLWLLYERPGSARMGGIGGAGEAISYFLAVLAFPVVVHLASSTEWDVRQNFKIVLLFVGASFGGRFITYFITMSKIGFHLPNLFSYAGWFLAGVLMVWIFEKKKKGQANFFFIRNLLFAICGLIVLGVLSPHRARIWFAMAIVVGIAYLYGHMKKAVFLIILIGGFGLLLAVTNYSRLPAGMKRSLTTFTPRALVRDARRDFGREGISAEVGWSSGWRTYMYKQAWREIRRRPFTGNGWAFSIEELLASLSVVDAQQAMAQGLATTGGYHNSVVQLAVSCGLPAALFFVIAYISIVRRFIIKFPQIPNADIRMIAGGVFGYLIADTGQMLTNGAGSSMFDMCVILAFLEGVMMRVRAEEQSVAVKETVKEATRSKIAGMGGGAMPVRPRPRPLQS
ncbi:MAG: O-antigen ligase family protein [Verrucomicrobia bacterium]|nr:O-antigen ligase family protein [Verrucomicrobiota bacterium]